MIDGQIEAKDVYELLAGYYPTSNSLTTAITAEIANGVNDAGLDYPAFVAVVAKYRAQDAKAHWAPTLRQLRQYFPPRAATVEVRPDHEKRWVTWPARLYHSPQRTTFVKLWARGKTVEAFELLLSVPGLTEEERIGAKANLQWAHNFNRWGAELRAKFLKKHPKWKQGTDESQTRFHEVFKSYSETRLDPEAPERRAQG